jgi:hypothetical protein
MNRRIAFGVIAILQLVDLASTWLGVRQGLSEMDGTSLFHLALLKLGTLALLGILLYRRPAKFVWAACAVFAAIMLPILANNFYLITHAH